VKQATYANRPTVVASFAGEQAGLHAKWSMAATTAG
jgi:hypothetical protein